MANLKFNGTSYTNIAAIVVTDSNEENKGYLELTEYCGRTFAIPFKKRKLRIEAKSDVNKLVTSNTATIIGTTEYAVVGNSLEVEGFVENTNNKKIGSVPQDGWFL